MIFRNSSSEIFSSYHQPIGFFTHEGTFHCDSLIASLSGTDTICFSKRKSIPSRNSELGI